MRSGGWKPFWTSLFAALLLLLPLAGGTVLLTRQQARARVQTAEPQSGVAVRLPKANDYATVLICVAGEQPSFALLYLNADQNCIRLLSVPAVLTVPFGGEETSLARCYAAAGPARCREALSAALPLPEDTRYLALSPAVLAEIGGQFGAVRVGFSGALSAEELASAGVGAAVQELSVKAAWEFTSGLDAAGTAAPEHRAAAQAAVYDAFFRQKLELLPSALPDALRAHSSALLTDFSAQDYYRLEETLEFLANNAAAVYSAALPGVCEPDSGHYTLSDASFAAVQTLFNISPTSAQAVSDSEP